jgi:hypothetical protein
MATTPRQRVIGILRSPTAKRIRFIAPAKYVGDVTIDHTTFETVAKAIDTMQIDITVKPPAAFTPGVAAEYDQPNTTIPIPIPTNNTIPITFGTLRLRSGTLTVPPIIGREGEAIVMHECTHAYFDLQSSKLGATDDEAIASVVGALYSRMTGLPGWRWGDFVPGIYQASLVVADRLLHQYQLGQAAIPRVDEQAFRTLRGYVAMDPAYVKDDGPASLKHLITGKDDRYAYDG